MRKRMRKNIETDSHVVPMLLTTTPRPKVWHDFVDQLIADGFLYDPVIHEWKRASTGKRGRISWNDEGAWLREPVYDDDDHSVAAITQRVGSGGPIR